MRNFKKLALVGAFVVTTAFSVTACGSSNGTTQEATTVDSQAEQDSKRAAYREEQSRLAERNIPNVKPTIPKNIDFGPKL